MKGFTLPEVIIAIFVIFVGVLAIWELFPFSLQERKMAEMTTIASLLAKEKMEEIISKPYDVILSEPITSLAPPFANYSREVKVTYFDPITNSTTSTDTGIKKIEVIVYWKSFLGISEKIFRITTLVSKK